MGIIVQKFGGTSVADIEKIKRCAGYVKEEIALGNRVVVVVSAMAGTTNRLINWVREITPQLNTREAEICYDMVVSSGESIVSGLLALALQEIGVNAVGWQGWQLPIKTNDKSTKARIEKIETAKIKSALAKGQVPVVTGFQGVDKDGILTTLGRGGSDTTATALAAALKAKRCDIYTDVEGVYTADPRIVHKAQKLDVISYEIMLELASQGAKVMETRSVETAFAYGVPLKVVSSFNPGSGTSIVGKEKVMDKRSVYSIASRLSDDLVCLRGYPKDPQKLFHLFDVLSENGLEIDMMQQHESTHKGSVDVSFTIAKDNKDKLVALLLQNRLEFGYKDLDINRDIAKISIIGIGTKSHTDILQQLLKTLSDKNIELLSLSSSEITISILIPSEYAELAVRSLHHDYGLDKPGEHHAA